MRIALDAMGGDNGPNILVEAAVQVLQSNRDNLEILLVGDKDLLEDRLPSKRPPGLSVIHAPEKVEMHGSPASVLRRKKNSSIAVASRLQKQGEVDAFISAGNTGAVVVSSLLTLGAIEGVSRPAIASPFPSKTGICTVLDAGANADCKAENLLQFGIMGSLYVNHIFGIEKPKVGLLSIGEESSKGNNLTLETHRLLSESDLNFIGNIEGGDVLRGTVDVVICDGFVGNVILKFTESIFDMVFSTIDTSTRANPFGRIGTYFLKSAFTKLKQELNYEEYGGAPLLGVQGVTIICHGGSSIKAIRNAIKVAQRLVQDRINECIKTQLKEETSSATKTPRH